jgi:hypothetical protein
MATSGHFYWPQMGTSDWPLTHLAGTLVTIVRDDTTIAFYDVKTGWLLIEHPRPEPSTRYVGNGKPRGPRRAPTAGSSPKS